MSTVGERIRERRLALGLSQRDLASEGVSYAYISRLEANTRGPSVRALRKLAVKLDVSVHWLETGEEDPPRSWPASSSATNAARCLRRPAHSRAGCSATLVEPIPARA